MIQGSVPPEGMAPPAMPGAEGSSTQAFFRDGYQARVDGQPATSAPDAGGGGHHAWIAGWDAANAGLPQEVASVYRAIAALQAQAQQDSVAGAGSL